ncbi:MAG: polysaccharide deacetylase [Niastella sp. SCN 39-18]|nr:polysaccharide deacetylase family protein [Sphingobacteriales bacterium]ODT54088.1 MAG: polysaccharide deacetylase [Niastella sp. SCN 39-18]OJW09753.1 MAG: polysaccharide deacetylase family protein [Sphingobacteriales bacterium 39-19]
MFYFVKTPGWLKKVYHDRIWDMPDKEKDTLYLSFDDGPHPTITPALLDLLQNYQAKATFFCIGENVKKYPDVYQRILQEGHAVGNHTQTHLNGWKTKDEIYLADIRQAANSIESNLFRPPYGRMTRFQQKQLMRQPHPLQVVMWSVISGDFDVRIHPERCLQNVLYNSKPGSIIVFHDSDKAKKNMEFAVPRTLNYFSKQGFSFDKIEV